MAGWGTIKKNGELNFPSLFCSCIIIMSLSKFWPF